VQSKEGIDAVIVDSVLKVRKGLQGPNQAARANGANGTSLVVPQASVPTINETTDALQEVDLNGKGSNKSESAVV
jgi:glycerophosphodiester phosphodiesterase